MSLPNTQQPYLGNALIGACLAILSSVPVSAYIGSLLGNTYLTRVLIYGLILLWIISGAICIFFKTYKNEHKKLSLKFVMLWFVSVWFWPLLIITNRK